MRGGAGGARLTGIVHGDISLVAGLPNKERESKKGGEGRRAGAWGGYNSCRRTVEEQEDEAQICRIKRQKQGAGEGGKWQEEE